MADAITYADLRFVKAPLKKSVSSRPGQDPEAYEDGDGELTYENVQVPAVPGGASGPASSGLGDRAGRAPSAGVRSEQTPSSWSSVTSPAVGRVLPCSATCLQRLLLGLLLTCLLLGVGVICLGVRYLQVSQQLQHMNRVLEATNSSLRQQLLQKIAQLRQKDKDLQESRSQLAQSQEALQDKQRVHQATEEQRHTCQLDREKTKETLEKEKQQRGALQGRLSSVRDTLRRFFKCVSADTCCPVGWTSHKKSCLFFSPTRKNWEESQTHCSSLSSNLAIFSEINRHSSENGLAGLSSLVSDSYWVGTNSNMGRVGTWSTDYSHSWSQFQSPKCIKLQHWWPKLQLEAKCATLLPYICELSAFRFPDEDHSLE